jgi:hypothetical protein
MRTAKARKSRQQQSCWRALAQRRSDRGGARGSDLKKRTTVVTTGHVFMEKASCGFRCCAAYRLVAA